MSCAKDGGGIVGTGVLIPLIIPTLRRKFASMIRKARAYLQDIELGESHRRIIVTHAPFGRYIRKELSQLLHLSGDSAQVQLSGEKAGHFEEEEARESSRDKAVVNSVS